MNTITNSVAPGHEAIETRQHATWASGAWLTRVTRREEFHGRYI